MEKKEIIVAIMAAIVFTDIRKMRTTQREAVEDSAKIAVSLYTKVCNNLQSHENKCVPKADVH